jgi:putative hemolysin
MVAESPAFAIAARLASRRDHIIDVLIAERAPKLAANPAWTLMRPLIYLMLDYGKARTLADAIAPMGGRAALELISELLEVTVEVHGLERAPKSGRLIAVCNHPSGIADGIAVWDVLKGPRPEVMFYANSDVHRVTPRFDEVLIPVEWVEAKRTRERTRTTLVLTREAMEAEKALVIFPAGRLARRTLGPIGRGGRRLSDPPWAPSAFSVARKYDAPILPMHLAGPWSSLFHFFDGFSGELRDITLFHELLNKRGRRFRLTIGEPVAAADLPADPAEAALAMKDHVERALPRQERGRWP